MCTHGSACVASIHSVKFSKWKQPLGTPWRPPSFLQSQGDLPRLAPLCLTLTDTSLPVCLSLQLWLKYLRDTLPPTSWLHHRPLSDLMTVWPLYCQGHRGVPWALEQGPQNFLEPDFCRGSVGIVLVRSQEQRSRSQRPPRQAREAAGVP